MGMESARQAPVALELCVAGNFASESSGKATGAGTTSYGALTNGTPPQPNAPVTVLEYSFDGTTQYYTTPGGKLPVTDYDVDFVGGTTVQLPTFDPRRLAEAMEREHAELAAVWVDERDARAEAPGGQRFDRIYENNFKTTDRSAVVDVFDRCRYGQLQQGAAVS